MRIAVELHALDAAVSVALIGIEEAGGSISHHPYFVRVGGQLTDSPLWRTDHLPRREGS